MFRSRYYLLFALLTYLWCATGLDRLASVSGVLSNESNSSFVMANDQPGQLVIHHVGHRDAHEPTVQDAGDGHDDAHGHDDHVVPYCDDSASATLAKEAKVGKPNTFAFVLSVALWLPDHFTPYFPRPRSEPWHSAALEFAHTLRLLI